MRSTLDLPRELLQEAQQGLSCKSKTDTIVHALRELVRGMRIEELETLPGKVELDIDIARSRRRPSAAPAR